MLETGSSSIDVQGYCDPKFDKVRDVLAESIASGADVGASVAVTLDGEMVIDLWGGYQDTGGQKSWQ
jgi:hypothetical protein